MTDPTDERFEGERAHRPRLLLVEDDDDIRGSLEDVLNDLGYEVRAEPSAEAGLSTLRQYSPDAIVADVRMPGLSGIEFCQRLTADGPAVPVVLMTAFGEVEMAVEALRAGAFDFITKPIALDQLASVLDRAIQRPRTKTGILRLQDPELPDGSRYGLIGSSDALRALLERIARVAPTDATVLITGESGTGKELVARALHARSPRRDGPFVALSCAALPAEQLEAELFGHRKSASPGAVEPRDGLLHAAHRGTLFLDEIGEMPLELQPKLLRMLEDPRARPGGADDPSLDVRVIAASHRDLEQAASQGQFREDLLFRLNVHHVRVPALRERGADVVELARHFLSRGNASGRPSYQLSAEAERALVGHSWPGNVRELENCLNAAAALTAGTTIGLRELPERLQSPSNGQAPATEQSASLEEVERRYIEVVLRATGWNKALAARKLGIDRATLYRKLLRLGLSEGP
ncbi:MAG TPA: sigma-54 dependent transcriptional regulator [Polyangiaceae bacterium]|nr:sigma-54 dependent transcriptional regulator [Polyangiaceae bacterium]